MGNSIPRLATALRKNEYFVDSLDKHLANAAEIKSTDEELVVIAAKSIAAYSRTITSPETPGNEFS